MSLDKNNVLKDIIKKVNDTWTEEDSRKRDEFFTKYEKLFQLENIDSLTKQKFKNFWAEAVFHWGGGGRQNAGNITKGELWEVSKENLKIIVDESKPLSERIKQLRNTSNQGNFIQSGTYSIILHMVNPKKHPTINDLTLNVLDELKLSSKKERKTEEWNWVPKLENTILKLCDENNVDTWKVDWVWQEISKELKLINHLEKLNKIITKFKENRESISADWTLGENSDNEKTRKEFVTKYSLDNIKKLTLENYVEGKIDSSGEKTRNNFCSELSDLDPYGRLGGPDGQFVWGIYIKKESQEYEIPLDTNLRKELFAKKSKEEVYSIIQENIIKIIQYGETSNFSKLNEQTIIDKRFKSKILAVYFPKENLMIHAKTELEIIAVAFGLFTKKEIKKKSSIDIQQSLLRFKESQQNLKDLNNLEYSHILWYYSHGDEEDLKVPIFKDTIIVTKNIELLEDKKQIIFYGPPGTGKTHNGMLLARSFVSDNTPVDFEKVRINKNVQRNDIQKINLTDDQYHEYVLKKINDECMLEGYTLTQEQGSKHLYSLKNNTNEIRLAVHFSSSSTQSTDDLYLGVPTLMVDFLAGVPEKNRFHLILNDSVKNFVVLPFEIEQKYARFVDSPGIGKWDKEGIKQHAYHITVTSNGSELPVRDGTHGQETKYDCEKFVRNIKMIFGNFIRNVTFHPSYSYEEFVEGIRPKLNNNELLYEIQNGIFKSICDDAKEDSDNKYVLFIDEINRGNISKIFGELITLIENDKRGLLQSSLTYTQESFTIPKNLYIIGTMNTADKSLSLLDIALRRRFGFVELMPEKDLIQNAIEVEGIKFKPSDILVTLNKKIKDKVGRERQIGHSYFMKKGSQITTGKELQSAFVNEIVPLLQEYLYEENEDLWEVLGDGFVDKDKSELKPEWRETLKDFKDALEKLPDP
jgi:hypothetical protein